VVLFHNGRGSQEAIFGDAKTNAAFNVIPCRRLAGNQIFTLRAKIAGVFILAILSNALNLLDVSAYWQWIVKGLIIIVAVAFYTQKRR